MFLAVQTSLQFNFFCRVRWRLNYFVLRDASFRVIGTRWFHLSHVQNCRQLILVFGGIYSLKNWMASHARKLFTSFAQAHVRASFAQARNHVDNWNIKMNMQRKGLHNILGRDEMGDEFRCALFAWYVGPLACKGIVSLSKQGSEWMPWILNGNRPWS